MSDGPQYSEQSERSKEQIKALEKDEASALKEGDAERAGQDRTRIEQLNAFVIRAAEYANAQQQTQQAIEASTKTYSEFQKGLVDLNAQIEAANISIQAARTKQEALTYSGPAKLESDQTKEGDIAQREKTKSDNAKKAESKKEATQSYEQQLSTEEDQLAAGRASLAALETVARNTKASHELNQQHKDLTQMMADSTTAQIAAQKEKNAELEAAIRRLQDGQRQSRNNAQ